MRFLRSAGFEELQFLRRYCAKLIYEVQAYGGGVSWNSLPDLYVMAIFGLLGYLFERFKFPLAPLVLGTILGPLAEANFMTTMLSFNNDWTIFFTRPISGAILAIAIVSLLWPLVRAVRAHFRKDPPRGQTQTP